MIVLVSACVAILSFFLVFAVVTYVKQERNENIFRRMRRYNVTDSKSQQRSKETFMQSFYRIVQQVAKPFVSKSFLPLDLKLRQAGIPLLGAEFVVANLIISGVVGVLIYMLTIEETFAMIAAAIVPFVCWFMLSVLIRKRKNAFTEQLGDCLITFANALRAGYSFQQAMDVIAKEMESPIAQEFRRTSTDVKMGIPLETALEQMDKRVSSTDFTLVVTAVLIQREVGGNLAQILDSISDTIAERIRMKREINALTAQGRLSAVILLLLPFVAGLFTYIFNKSQMMILFEETVGQIAVAASIVMDIIGFLIIRRIIDIEV